MAESLKLNYSQEGMANTYYSTCTQNIASHMQAIWLVTYVCESIKVDSCSVIYRNQV